MPAVEAMRGSWPAGPAWAHELRVSSSIAKTLIVKVDEVGRQTSSDFGSG
jgi:hypothetical protein